MTIHELFNMAYKATGYADDRILNVEEQWRHGIITEQEARVAVMSIIKWPHKREQKG